MKNFLNLLSVSVLLAVVLVAAIIVPHHAFAQDASAPVTFNPAVQFVGWVCANQSWTVYVLGLLIAHTGLSGASAILKKYGITEDSPAVGFLVKVIRMAAMDVKPPQAAIVSQAATIMAASPSTTANAAAPAVAQAAAEMKVAS